MAPQSECGRLLGLHAALMMGCLLVSQPLHERVLCGEERAERPRRQPSPPSLCPRCPCCFRDGVKWRLNRCNFDDYSAWADEADKVLARRNVDLSRLPYRVYLTPPGACDFVGEPQAVGRPGLRMLSSVCMHSGCCSWCLPAHSVACKRLHWTVFRRPCVPRLRHQEGLPCLDRRAGLGRGPGHCARVGERSRVRTKQPGSRPSGLARRSGAAPGLRRVPAPTGSHAGYHRWPRCPPPPSRRTTFTCTMPARTNRMANTMNVRACSVYQLEKNCCSGRPGGTPARLMACCHGLPLARAPCRR